MADKSDPGSQAESGSAAGAPADENDALIAELEAEQATTGGKAKPAAKPAKPAVAAPDADDDADEDEAAAPEDDDEDAAPDAEPDDDEDPDAEDDADEDDEPAAEAGKDPELAKRLAAVRRTEARQRERLAADRTAFERERSEWQTQTRTVTEAQKRFEAVAARAKHDPAGALAALGLTDADFEYAAQQVYARSPAAAKKDGYRDAADRAMREREATDKLSANDRRIADLEAKLARRDQQAAVELELNTYFKRAIRKADDTTPRVKALIAKNPARARADLAATALALSEKNNGQLPKSKVLLAAHEKKIARQIRDYGLDDAAALAAETDPKPVGKKPAGAAAKPATGKPAKPAVADDAETDETTIPSTADLVRELQAARAN